jgi:PTS system ascorbate-specific IIA component
MVGIMIIAHGGLAESLIASATHMLGSQPERLLGLSVTGSAQTEAAFEQARAMAVTLDDGAGVIVLTDMVGGTPANIATHLVKAGSIEGVAGVNLPMLMRTLTYRCNPLSTVVAKAVSGGTECVATLTRGERHAAG